MRIIRKATGSAVVMQLGNRVVNMNDGKRLESLIATAADTYARRGILAIQKVDPPIKVVGRAPFLKVIMLKSLWVDFTGAWTERGGRMIHIEAKSTHSETLACGRDGGLTARQLEAFEYWQKAGACCALIVEGPDGRFWFWAYEKILEYRKGRKTLKISDGEPIISADGLALDFRKNLADNF